MPGPKPGCCEVLGPKGSRTNHDETWLTLFDLYRAIGQQERFETAAIDFAGRFGRSAPQWFSIPEAVGRMHGGRRRQRPRAARSSRRTGRRPRRWARRPWWP